MNPQVITIERKSYILTIMLALACIHTTSAQVVDYQKADSLKVVSLLHEASQDGTSRAVSRPSLMLHFARQLRGTPYVAKTLERNATEQVVVNMCELDCTTYVEAVVALTLCASRGQTSWSDYTSTLRKLRYKDGQVDYTSRLHYFSYWIDSNERQGTVSEVTSNEKPFTAMQTLCLNYMTTHQQYYPMLKGHADRVEKIATMEKELSGRKVRYIPKSAIKNTTLLRQVIHDGDILAIVTNKRGLDTSHLGIAVWHSDGLHLLNASQIRHKVVEEPMTLYEYMQKHPSQMGIRVVRLKE